MVCEVAVEVARVEEEVRAEEPSPRTAFPSTFASTSPISLSSSATTLVMDAFRKIDIDQYDEDVLLETELYEADPRDPSQVLDDARQRASAVRSALSKCVTPAPAHIHQQMTCALSCRKRRGDVPSALATILDSAPYGPNVDDAKVPSPLPSPSSPDSRTRHTDADAADARDDPEQHQVERDPGHCARARARRAGHAHEVPLQGHGHARLGRRQRERPPGVAREGASPARSSLSLSCSNHG